MATLRGSQSLYDIGNKPPTVIWTVVRGDTSGFKVYVTDDAKQPLILKGEESQWSINMKIKRPNSASDLGVITDNATVVMSLYPVADEDDLVGEFTVGLQRKNQNNLKQETSLIFKYQTQAEYGQFARVA
jgi:hypothetical protein